MSVGPFVDAGDVLGAVVLPAELEVEPVFDAEAELLAGAEELAGADELAGALLLLPGMVIVTPALAQ